MIRNVLKQLCRPFYQIIVQPQILAKLIQLTLLSVGRKNTHVPLNILSIVYVRYSAKIYHLLAIYHLYRPSTIGSQS